VHSLKKISRASSAGSWLLPGARSTAITGARSSLAEKLALFALAALVIYATARNICHAWSSPSGMRICTLLIAQQNIFPCCGKPSRSRDGQPLAFTYWNAPRRLYPQRKSGLPWRSILGFAVTLLCLFVAIRTRKGAATP